MDRKAGRDRPNPRVSKSSSARAFRYVIALGFLAGVLLLAGLGVFGYLEYVRGGGQTPVPPGMTRQGETLRVSTAGAPAREVLSTPSPLGLPRGSGTDSISATATAACASFIAEFPGTPCPAPGATGIELTATASCAEFIAQFPGTPCP